MEPLTVASALGLVVVLMMICVVAIYVRQESRPKKKPLKYSGLKKVRKPLGKKRKPKKSKPKTKKKKGKKKRKKK